MATGDPGLDLIGLIGGVVLNGIGTINRAQSAAASANALRLNAGHADLATWEPYTFEVTTVEATRTGHLRAAWSTEVGPRLADRTRGGGAE